MLIQAHPRVGDEQQLQLPPPHPGPLCGDPRQGVNLLRGRDLLEGDSVVDRLGVGVELPGPPHATQQVTAGEDVALLHAGAEHGGQATSGVVGDRLGGSEVDDLLKVVTRELPARHVGDDREHELLADSRLLITVTDRPRRHPRWPALRVEVVGDQVSALRPAQLRRRRAHEPFDDLVRLGDRGRLVACGGVLRPASLLPTQPPVPIWSARWIDAHAHVELEDFASLSVCLHISHTCHRCASAEAKTQQAHRGISWGTGRSGMGNAPGGPGQKRRTF